MQDPKSDPAAEVRELAAQERERAADEPDRAADERDRDGDERDRGVRLLVATLGRQRGPKVAQIDLARKPRVA